MTDHSVPYEYLKTFFWWTGPNLCGYPVPTSTNGTLYSHRIDSRPLASSSRLRPSNLLSSPTNRGPLEKISYSKGLESIDSVVQNRYCFPGDGTYYLEQLKATTLSEFPYPVVNLSRFSTPDWGLDLRLKVADLAVDLTSDVAEFGDTVRTVYDLAKGVKDGWDLFHGRIPKRWRKRVTPCSIPASVLEFQYGIRPLVQDVVDSFSELTSRLQKPYYKRVSAYSRNVENYPEGDYITTTRSRAYVQVDHDGTGFSIGNPLSLAWEAVPFSFVVDWGIGVGDYLKALSATAGLTIIGISATHKRVVNTENPGPYHVGYSPVKSSYYRYESIQREAPGSIPFPQRPKINFKSSWNTLTNAISLLWAVNKRCR